MKNLCIVDTSSLIYLSEIELANKPLHRWLWDEFKVIYSETVWIEIQRHLGDMGQDAKILRKKGSQCLWPLPVMLTYEKTIFASFYRQIEVGKCAKCKRPFFEDRLFEPNLDQQEDQGERHNCCIALNAVLTSQQYGQVVFLTDDHRAIRDYVAPLFRDFPLGSIWTSQDLVLYLFMKRRRRIPPDAAQNALRDIVAKATQTLRSQPEEFVHKAKQEWIVRLNTYQKRVRRVDTVLSHFEGN